MADEFERIRVELVNENLSNSFATSLTKISNERRLKSNQMDFYSTPSQRGSIFQIFESSDVLLIHG